MMGRDNDDEIIQANLRIDHELLQALKRLGVVRSQYDLSRLCGKGCSYYSCMRAKGYGLKLGSLTFLSVRIGSTIRSCQNARVVKVLKYAQRLVQNSIEEKCRLQEYGMRGADMKSSRKSARTWRAGNAD
jgi:hypothetical protein